MTLGASIEQAITQARALAGDDWAQVRIVAPSAGSADLARRALGGRGPFLRVRFSTVEVLLSELGVPALVREGRSAEPAGWLAATLEEQIARLTREGRLEGHGATLSRPGWLPTLESSLRALEQARLQPAELRAIDAPDGARERLQILADLLEAVDGRRREANLYSRTDVHVAAVAAAADDDLPVHRDQATVVLGDRALAPAAFEALARWCRARPSVRLALPPLEHLPPAPHGIRAAAEAAEVVSASGDDRSATDRVRNWAFSESAPAVAPEAPHTVEAVRNLDEHREVRAAVRRALDGVHTGIALDRIAFVLPDPGPAEPLREALEEAGLPATWLTGPPLATAGPARLLLHALTVSDTGSRAEDWYRLLRAPTLRLRAHLGPEATRGRGRWRALLSELGIPRGTEKILAGLTDLAEALDPDEEASKLASVQALLRSIGALQAAFDAWPRSATFAEHARAWAPWLRAWASRRPERLAVEGLLDGVGRAAGPELSRRDARRMLERLLHSTPWLGGRLDEPTVRVLAPMEALGGEFDLVCVLGLCEGRLPRARAEDPLLSDAVVTCIREATGVQLEDADARRENERRRFAATLTAARGALWLSAPAHELRTGRPLAPSSLLFDVKAALEGRPVALAELEAWLSRPDSDAVGVPEDPDRAISGAERRLAQARRAPPEAARALARPPIPRRLLGLHRAIDRVRANPDAPPLDAWTGRIDPAVLEAALAPRPLGPGAVQRLLHSPHRFFFQDLLGGWPASRLPRDADPTEPWWLRRAVQSAFTRAQTWAALCSDVDGWLEAVLADDARVDELPEVTRALVGARFRQDLEQVGAAVEALTAATPLNLPEAPVDGTPWSIAAQEAWRADEALLGFSYGKLNKTLKIPAHDLGSACRSLAARNLGTATIVGVGKPGSTGGPPTVGTGAVEHLAAQLKDALLRAHRLAEGGLWPTAGDTRLFRLEREAALEVSSDGLVDRLLGAAEEAL